MMTAFIIIFALIMTYIALRYPPGIACIFIILSMSQTYGIGALLPGALSFIIGFLAFIGACVSFLKLWQCHKHNEVARRTFFIAVIAAIAALWPGLAIFANGGGIIEVIDELTINGMFGVIIALAYWDNQWARKLIVATILLQLFISIAILQYPNKQLSVFKASFYNSAYSVDYDKLGMEKPENERESAQFLNSLQLSFYATSGFIIGIYLFFTPRLFYQRLVGIVLSLFALLCIYFSFSRGALFSLIVAAVVVLTQHLKNRNRVVMLFFILLSIALAVLIIEPDPSSLNSGNSYLSMVVESISATGSGESDQYRFQALSESVSVLFGHPLFGTGSVESYFHETPFFPHQAPLISAVLHGLPGGICIAIIYWIVIVGVFSQKRQLFTSEYAENPGSGYVDFIDRNEVTLTIIFGVLIFIFGMTNGHTGKMLQYVFLGYACLPWIYSNKYSVRSIA